MSVPRLNPRTRDEIIKAVFQYQDAMLSHAFVLLRDWAQAEDVLQDAYLVVMDKWKDFQPGSSLYAWMRQIVVYKAMQVRRSRAAGKVATVDEELLTVVARTVENRLDEKMAEIQQTTHRVLQECMAGLGAFSTGLLTEFYWQMSSCEALAKTHGRSVNAIRLVLSRLRMQLRECIKRRLNTEGTRL